MRKRKNLIFMLLLLMLCLSFSGCTSRENAETGTMMETQIQKNDTEQMEKRIGEILGKTPACEGWAPSIAEMINTVFHTYQWTFEPYKIDEEFYVVKFTGTYSPNPDLPNLSQSGTISYFVNPETEEVKLYTDPDGISSVFLVYILN